MFRLGSDVGYTFDGDIASTLDSNVGLTSGSDFRPTLDYYFDLTLDCDVFATLYLDIGFYLSDRINVYLNFQFLSPFF